MYHVMWVTVEESSSVQDSQIRLAVSGRACDGRLGSEDLACRIGRKLLCEREVMTKVRGHDDDPYRHDHRHGHLGKQQGPEGPTLPVLLKV